jgi:hypothetical protein
MKKEKRNFLRGKVVRNDFIFPDLSSFRHIIPRKNINSISFHARIIVRNFVSNQSSNVTKVCKKNCNNKPRKNTFNKILKFLSAFDLFPIFHCNIKQQA